MAAKPPTIAELTWIGDLKFAVTLSKMAMTVDSAGLAGPSPVDALAAALAGCMSIDLAHILTQGRHAFRGLGSRLVADRAQDNPHRIVRVSLHFTVEGDVPPDAVARAIQLSHDKYCSVWHSMRQDIEFATSYDIRA